MVHPIEDHNQTWQVNYILISYKIKYEIRKRFSEYDFGNFEYVFIGKKRLFVVVVVLNKF